MTVLHIFPDQNFPGFDVIRRLSDKDTCLDIKMPKPDVRASRGWASLY